MNVRLFDWRDLPVLHRCRNRTVFLDAALVLTRGPMLVPGVLMSFFSPAIGATTCVSADQEGGRSQIFGQVIQAKDSQYGHITFLTPEEALDSPELSALLDALMTISGEKGACRLLAEVDEKTMAFEALRRSSFAIYTHQRIWEFVGPKQNDANKNKLSSAWRVAGSKDGLAIRALYNNLVPGLVQQIEPFSNSQLPSGLVYREDGELLAYVAINYGYRGIWAQPFVHPDAQDVTGQLLSLIQYLPNRGSRPVYMCIRSYQSWLESALEELEARPAARQAVMVKHLAVVQKAVRPLAVPAMDTGQPEISAPIARTERKT